MIGTYGQAHRPQARFLAAVAPSQTPHATHPCAVLPMLGIIKHYYIHILLFIEYAVMGFKYAMYHHRSKLN